MTLDSERVLVHPLLGYISGMCSDEMAHTKIDRKVLKAKGLAHDLEAERDRYREALERAREQLEKFGYKGPKQIGRALITIDKALGSPDRAALPRNQSRMED